MLDIGVDSGLLRIDADLDGIVHRPRNRVFTYYVLRIN